MVKKYYFLVLLIVILFNYANAENKTVDIPVEIIPAEVSASELDAWLSQNEDNFDFYVEGRSIAEYRQETGQKIVKARIKAKNDIAFLEQNLKEMLTGIEKKDQELRVSTKEKIEKVYRVELSLEEKLYKRQQQRELSIMEQKKYPERKLAALRKDFSRQLTGLKEKGPKRLDMKIAEMPELDSELINEEGVKRKIKLDKNKRVIVESKKYGGELSERAKQRLRSR
jgi:beta-glucosidase-like glycosyl hydrolase